MSEENTSSSPPEGSIPPVDPIVADDLETLPGAETPTEGTPAATTAPAADPASAQTSEPWAVTAAAPAAAAAGSAGTSHPSRHVLMPKWVVFGVVGIALAALGFGVGWIAKPDTESSQPAASTSPFGSGNPFGENGPFGGNNGNGNNGGRNNENNGGLRVSGAFLGVSATAPSGDTEGAEVAQVVDNSPADDAGLEEGDVITKVDDTEITSPAELVQVISSRDSGDEVTVTYTRDGETETADVTLGDRADAPSQLPDSRSGTED